jgi:hypothetical protein
MVRLLGCLVVLLSGLVAGDGGIVEFYGREGEAPVPFRLHLTDPAGKPVAPANRVSWKDHFVIAQSDFVELREGEYRAVAERGPEYDALERPVSVSDRSEKVCRLNFTRLVDLSKEGWWSGDLHVHRPLKDIELLMRAEDLHVAPVITWWNKRDLWAGKEIPASTVTRFDHDRFYGVMAGEDEREGGALMFYGLPKPLAIGDATREYPSPVTYLLEAKKTPGAHVDIEKPFWWDTPTWLATGKVDTIGIANNHMCRSEMREKEAWGKPRPEDRLPPPMGIGYWVQEIYYHVLNCGLRVAPSAGSASGVLPNPVGYNRVYVHLDGDLSYEKWFEGLRAGRSFVTNGPLLRVTANGKLPGEVFTAGKPLSIELAAKLDGRDPVEAFEIVRDGKVERTVPAKDALGRLEFASSGWFLVRSVAKNEKTFRFASTAPFYVEIGAEKRRVSRSSARFFADWVEERMGRIRQAVKDEKQLAEILEPQLKAKEFWSELAKKANAD